MAELNIRFVTLKHKNKLDDVWNFEMKINILNHHYIKGTSSNPNDPVLILDPWRGGVFYEE